MSEKEVSEELVDGVEGLMLELLSHDDPAKRAEFIAALIHDGFDPELVRELSENLLANKAAMKGIL